jgi:hypothetical protein
LPARHCPSQLITLLITLIIFRGSYLTHVMYRRGRRVTSSSSITLMTFIFPDHFGQLSGSTFPDQVRDRLLFSGSALPNFSWVPWRIHLVQGYRVSFHPGFVFFLAPADIAVISIVTNRPYLPEDRCSPLSGTWEHMAANHSSASSRAGEKPDR